MWNSSASKSSLAKLSVGIGAVIFTTCAMSSPSEPSYVYDEPIDAVKQLTASGDSWSTSNTAQANEHATEKDNGLGIADVIAYVKESLGLPKKDVAEIFGVTRQTLHSYSKPSYQAHSINKGTLQRAFDIEGIIREIEPSFMHSPGAMAKNFSVGGDTLLSLLSQPDLDQRKILEVASLLAERIAKHSVVEKSKGNDQALYDLTRSV